jgi:hypothetical protein
VNHSALRTSLRRVPKTNSDKQLGHWIASQREDYKSGSLDPEYVDRLNAAGFDWDPHKTTWEEMFKSGFPCIEPFEHH